jgi:YesN/AraC family two-component response regulator
MKVLILDDEPPARRGLKAALNDIGVTFSGRHICTVVLSFA